MFTGLATAIITPFNDQLEIDLDSLRKVVQFQLSNGANAIIALGTTGEAATIEADERRQIVQTVVNEVRGRIPVIVGTGTNNLKQVLENNRSAQECRADGLLIVNPYYNKGTQASLVEYYKYVAKNTKLPILLYNVPSRTGMNVLPETAVKIRQECPNVVGMKEASGDTSQIAKLIATRPEGLRVYAGNDDQTVSIMALGGEGTISVLGNIFPKEMKLLSDAMLKADLASARKIFNKYLKMMNLLFVETNPMPVKFAASLLGLCKNTVRLPLIPASECAMKQIKEEYARLTA